MSRSILATAFLCAVAIAPAAMAQQPAPTMPRDSMHRTERRIVVTRNMGSGEGMQMRQQMKGGVAAMLLGMTAELKLSDAQVTRLAALARSADAQETAMHASMDSVHRSMMAHGNANAPMQMQMPAGMEERMKAAHAQMHANVRDALAVLTPDQLATAWEHHAGMGGMHGMRMMEGPGRVNVQVERMPK